MQNGNNGEYYYYVYNNQGDVIALLDSSFNYVANYTYDSWGKLISVTGDKTQGDGSIVLTYIEENAIIILGD
jgi:YD repeat-containing protein